MSIKRKIVSAVAALALAVTSAFSFTGCADISYAYVIDGESIPAGVYILYSGYALNDAEVKLGEEQPDLDTSAEGFDYYAQTVDGMSFADYVEQETLNYCKRHVVTNRLFDELGIVFEADEQKTLNDNVNTQWDYSVSSWASTLAYLKGCNTLGDYYQSIGVSKSSFKEVLTNSYKSGKIFTYYYGEGGVEEVAKDEIVDYIEENYSLARYFAISILDDNKEVIEDKDKLAELEELANGYIDKLNSGVSYSEVYEEYQDYLKAKEDEDKDTDKDDDGTDAHADDTEIAEDTENEEATEETEDTEGDGETEGTEGDEETEGTEGDEEAEGTEGDEETEDTEGDKETEDTDGDDKDEHDHEYDDSQYDRIINKDDTSPSKEFVKVLFAQDYGTAALFKADTYYYVVQRLDITESEDYVEDYTDTALQGLRGDDMADALAARYADYGASENTSAPNYAREQANNARQALSTITLIQYYSYYYSSLFSY